LIRPAGRDGEREESGGQVLNTLVATIEGLEAQLHALYEERSTVGYLSAETALESLEAQLCDLYAERELPGADGALARFGSLPALAHAAMGLEQQLAALYEEQSAHRFTVTEANQMVDSLEGQVASLLEERDSLSTQLESSRIESQAQRDKARALMAAVVEQALA